MTGYMTGIAPTDLLAALARTAADVEAAARAVIALGDEMGDGIPEVVEGEWMPAEILGHVCDGARVWGGRMRRVARLFQGRHDFSSFCENPEGQESTIVVVEKSEIIDAGDEIHFRLTASHFLWKMVRRLTGTLVEAGRGNLDAAGVEKLLREKSAAPAKWTAPPSGLFLERVDY